ncbi:MAG: potassium-transporting ATPase subunit KdpA [Nitrospira sp. LK70]|nr:potassium-transporting ATPase subunit KdpA [Nitrospira sp. LK70]
MTLHGLLQIALFFGVLLLVTKPLGLYMARVYKGRPPGLSVVLGPLERDIYHLCGMRSEEEMAWKRYAQSLLLFSAFGMAVLYVLLRCQQDLPLNPRHFGSLAPDLAFNTAASYVSNTNWQAYAGESTMSHLSQMAGLTAQDFMSSAATMGALMALIRGLVRRGTTTVGNFWVDLVRSILYILLPLAMVSSLMLISQGAVQSLTGSVFVQWLQPRHGNQPVQDSDGQADRQEGFGASQQVLALGPAATQVIARDLGTSGGGFFSANSAHPFESPTPLSDLLLLLLQTVVAAGLTYTYGKMVGDTRRGWAILSVMLVVLSVGAAITYQAESAGNPRILDLGVDLSITDQQPGGNMEGKEIRFGVAQTALVATATTATSTGAPNGMQDSLSPLGGLVPLVMMQSGEVILGGIGSGLSGMIVLVIIAVFISGLMVGRTPEYLGKKLEPYEIKMASVAILVMPIATLVATAFVLMTETGRDAIANPGPHGLTEVLYGFTSMANNNGSAFGGLNADSLLYNVSGALVMLLGRFWTTIPILALAGSFAAKKIVHISEGALPTHMPLFAVWLMIVTVVVSAMSFFPALALGPIAEHLLMTD